MLYGHSQLPATDPAPLDPLAGDRMSDDHFAAWLKETSQNEEVSSWTTPLSRRKAGAEHGKSAAPATAQAPSTPPARFPSLSSGDLPTAPAKKQKRMSSPESVKAQASNTPPAKKTAAAKTATPTSKSGRTSSKTSLPTPAPTPATRSRKSSNARSPSLSPTPPERAAASEQQAKGKKRAYVVVSSDSEDVPSSSAGGSRSSDKGRPVALSGFLQGMKRGQSNQRDAENESTRKSKGKRRAIVVSSDSDEEGLPSSSTGQSLASRTQEEVAKSTNWANMTKAERAERTARISQGRLAMAPEKKQARKDKLVTAWNAKTAEEKTEHSEKISRGQASMSADALAKREEARRRTREQKDPEERKRMHTVIGQASAATWASRGDEEKESIAVLREHGGETNLEIAFPEGAIMRRSDGWVNVTKLFSVLLNLRSTTATSWAARQTDIDVDSVPKGTLVGKWIGAEAAAAFAEKRKIRAQVAPLLSVDMRPEIIRSFQTKEEVLKKLPGGGQNAQRITERDRELARAGSQKYRDRKRQRQG